MHHIHKHFLKTYRLYSHLHCRNSSTLVQQARKLCSDTCPSLRLSPASLRYNATESQNASSIGSSTFSYHSQSNNEASSFRVGVLPWQHAAWAAACDLHVFNAALDCVLRAWMCVCFRPMCVCCVDIACKQVFIPVIGLSLAKMSNLFKKHYFYLHVLCCYDYHATLTDGMFQNKFSFMEK